MFKSVFLRRVSRVTLFSYSGVHIEHTQICQHDTAVTVYVLALQYGHRQSKSGRYNLQCGLTVSVLARR